MKNIIFVDSDGVMADFSTKVLELTGNTSEELGHHVWKHIQDLVIKPNRDTHELLKKFRNIENTSSLGFTKGQGTKVLNSAVRNGLVDKDGGNYTLSPKGYKVLKTLNANGVYKEGPDFYNSLDKMPDADVLWNYVSQHFTPVILTGKPMGNWAEDQKHAWYARNYPGTEVIVCMAREKAEKAAHRLGSARLDGAILIDDRESARGPWEANGGVFILHTSAGNTIAQLESHV